MNRMKRLIALAPSMLMAAVIFCGAAVGQESAPPSSAPAQVAAPADTPARPPKAAR